MNLGGVEHRADAGGDAAAEQADLVERRVGSDLRQRDLRHDGVLGERRRAHVVMQHAPAVRQAAGAVRHQPFTLGREERAAQVRLAAETELTVATLGDVQRDDVIATATGWSHPGRPPRTMPPPSWPSTVGKRPDGSRPLMV